MLFRGDHTPLPVLFGGFVPVSAYIGEILPAEQIMRTLSICPPGER